jgi:hypothetical protein
MYETSGMHPKSLHAVIIINQEDGVKTALMVVAHRQRERKLKGRGHDEHSEYKPLQEDVMILQAITM